ncbi:MAG: hypothetical protein LKH21_09520, partial [Solobacterium sp.]|nr:hypothetical protein [Solobacterium sp.]
MQKKGKERKGTGKAAAAFWLVVAIIAVLVSSTFNLIKDHINLGLDLRGGFEILYQVEPLKEGDDVDMTAVVNALEKRINVL